MGRECNQPGAERCKERGTDQVTVHLGFASASASGFRSAFTLRDVRDVESQMPCEVACAVRTALGVASPPLTQGSVTGKASAGLELIVAEQTTQSGWHEIEVTELMN